MASELAQVFLELTDFILKLVFPCPQLFRPVTERFFDFQKKLGEAKPILLATNLRRKLIS